LLFGLLAVPLDAFDVSHRLGEGGNAAVLSHVAGAGIVGGQCVPQAAVVFLQQIAQITRAGIRVLRGVGGVRAQGLRGAGHELHQADGAFGRNYMRRKPGFVFHDAAHQPAGQPVFVGGPVGQFRRREFYR